MTHIITYDAHGRGQQDGHFDFGHDLDGMDVITAVLGQDRSGWIFLGIGLGFFEIFWDYEILFYSYNFAAFICYDV
jgi:hypothetical protein